MFFKNRFEKRNMQMGLHDHFQTASAVANHIHHNLYSHTESQQK